MRLGLRSILLLVALILFIVAALSTGDTAFNLLCIGLACMAGGFLADQWKLPPMPPMSGHEMTGMMSEQDMAALTAARGADASKLFLTQMISHHQGAITMAQKEIDTGQYPPATQLARSILDTQQREIDTMNGMLGSM